MKHKQMVLISGILVLSLFAVQAQATPTFTLSENVGVQVGDTWSYSVTQGSEEEHWPVAETDFIESWNTAYGPITIVVHIDYLDYWEFEYYPERPVANISFGIGDLSQTDISHIEITSSYAYICNRTWDSSQQEYVRDDTLGSLYDFWLADTILYSYDSVQVDEMEIFNWYFWEIDTTSSEWNAYLEFTVWFRVHDKYSTDYDYWGWQSAPSDTETPFIDIERRGEHDQTGYLNCEVSTVNEDVVTLDIDEQMSNSWGDIMSEYTYSVEGNCRYPWTESVGTPLIQSTDWTANEADFLEFISTVGLDYSPVVYGDKEVLGRLTPYHSFHCWYPYGDYLFDYSTKIGVLIYLFIDWGDSFQEYSLSSTSFEYAYTEPDLSMTISQLNYAVESGSSFDVDAVIVNDGELSTAFNLEVIGVGFSGSASWVIDGLTQKVVALSVVSESGLDAGVYNVDIRLKCDGETIEQETITVDLTHPTTTTTTTTTDNGTTDGEATDGDDQPLSPVIVGTVIGVFGIIVIAIVMGQRRRRTDV